MGKGAYIESNSVRATKGQLGEAFDSKQWNCNGILFRMRWSMATLRLLLLFACKIGSTQTLPTSSNAERYDADVLILGAGMAGIAAAKTLQEEGVGNFLLLEARDHIGGRIRSAEFGGFRVELGAQWIHDVNPDEDRLSTPHPLWAAAKRCGLRGKFTNLDSFVLYNGSTRIDEAATISQYEDVQQAAELESNIKQRLGEEDISVREEYTRLRWNSRSSPLRQAIEWFYFDYAYGNAQPPEKTSLFGFYRVKNHTFRTLDFRVTDRRGYEYLADFIANSFMRVNDGRLHLNTLVKKITRNKEGVCVDTIEKGAPKSYCAQYAVCTFSLGVLQSDQDKLFRPRLPKWKRKAINSFSMGTLLRIYLQFDRSFWDNVEFIERVDSIRGRYPLFRPLNDLNSQFPDLRAANILAASITGAFATKVSTQPVEKSIQEVLTVLQEMYPSANVSHPNRVLIPTWEIDPLYRGTYSNVPLGVTSSTWHDLAAPCGRLYFSGEALDREHRATTHGAYISGSRTAQTIASKLPKYMK